MANTTFDYNAPEHVAAREREALVRPTALKVCAQYKRGLLTHDELVLMLTEIWGESDETLRARNVMPTY